MELSTFLQEIMNHSDLSAYQLSREMGLRSTSHVWMIMNKKAGCGLKTAIKIVKIGRKYGLPITLDDIFKKELSN